MAHSIVLNQQAMTLVRRKNDYDAAPQNRLVRSWFELSRDRPVIVYCQRPESIAHRCPLGRGILAWPGGEGGGRQNRKNRASGRA
jgi:hypothetical protein